MINLSRKSDYRVQSGCIPYRITNDLLEVLLVESSKGAWTVPSGGVEPDTSLEQNAVKEAFEEAGVFGQLTHYLGNFMYQKRGGKQQFCIVYAMRVTEEFSDYPERTTRIRKWMPIAQAMHEVKRGQRMFASLAANLVKQNAPEISG